VQKSVHSPAQKELQALLKELREGAGYNQRDLAALLGVPQSRVSDYERGESLMDVLVLRQYVTAFGIDLPEFIQRLETRLQKIEN
jgi:transcriptional regulator with XRE-family HTH domain